jgi:predicted TIM-barrel fold metal-dependent hydrolase
MLDTLGVDRAVLVQPSVYGTDNTVMLEALKTDPKRLRGVAVVPAAIDCADLHELHNAGVRGVRVNIVDVKDRKPGTLPLDSLKSLAKKIGPFGWHLELLMHVDEFPDLDELMASLPADTVLGHLGYMRTDKGSNAPGFKALLKALGQGRCWVKLTGPARISATGMPYDDVVPYAHALLKTNPDRIVWGTDWPHVITPGPMPNDGDLCDLLANWVSDAGVRQQVLVGNPARLYGF